VVVALKQHRNSDDQKSKFKAISSSCLLNNFVVKAKNADHIAVSEIAQIHHAVIHNVS